MSATRTLSDRDRSDAVVVSWSPAERAARRLVFVPRATGPTPWERVEQVRTDRGSWRTVGSEPVHRIDVEVPGGGN